MANRFVRASKYRHVFANAPKREEIWDGVKLTGNAWDSNWLAVNSQFIALCWNTAGGGAVGILNANEPAKLEPTKVPLISGHKGAVLGLEFDPFNEHILATCSEDATVKLWKIPEGGLKEEEHMEEEVQCLKGHKRKVGVLAYNPIASDIIASAAQDYDVKIWDVESGEAKINIEGHANIIQSIAWNYNGSLLVTNSKDKKVRIIDPRKQEVVAESESHIGVKGGRAIWLGKHDKIISVGFGRGATREYKIYDPRAFATPLTTSNIDNSAGVIMPFYDEDSDILFLAGKGDGAIRYFEIAPEEEEKKMVHPISQYASKDSTKACGQLPRRYCNVNNCEITRLYKVTGDQIHPLQFQVPRKSDLFQDDLFPACKGDEPSLTKDAWLGGEDADPILKSLEGGFQKAETVEKVFEKQEAEVELSNREKDELIAELQNKVAYLESQLKVKDAKIAELSGQ